MSAPRRKGGVQKADILKWANDQQQLDMRSKYILKELASFAMEDCCAWAQVATLAWAANCKERTAQYCLGKLREARLIEDTGRVHRLEGSSRSVPIYRIAPDVPGLGAPEAMGAKIAPIDDAHGCNVSAPVAELWVQNSTSMGASCVHPLRDQGVHKLAIARSEGARDLDEVFRQIEAAAPAAILRFSDADAAFDALAKAAADGVAVERLPDALRLMAAHPEFRSRKHPPQLHAWLAKRQFVGWLRDLDASADVAASPAARRGFAGPAELRAAVAQAKGETFAASYIDRSGWDDQAKAIVPWSSTAAERLRGAHAIISEFGASIGAPQGRGRA